MTLGTIGQAALLGMHLLALPVVAKAETGTPTYQGTVGAGVFGPRRVASTESGRIAVVDARGLLSLLTKRGDLIGTVQSGVVAISAGDGKVYAATEGAELVTLDEAYGKVIGRAALGVSTPPTAIFHDAVRGVIWMVYASGAVEARNTDGTVAAHFGQEATGPLYRLVDVAVDPATGLVWVAQDRSDPAGMIFALDGASGARTATLGAGGTGPVKMMGALLIGDGSRLHLSDLFYNKVEVVAADGTPVQTIGVTATGAGALSQPTGLAFMQNGDLLVANLFSGKLDRYGDGTPLPTCDGDSDCDGMTDAWELARGLDPASPRDALADPDGDGLPNLQEFALATDPASGDTDGDGESDAVELANGTDPLRAPSRKPVLLASRATEFVPGLVRLSAAVTEVPDPAGCSASWTQTGGDAVALSGGSGFTPVFVARRAGTFGFSVVGTCAGVASDPVHVSATVINVPPRAEAPRVVTVARGGRLSLSALDSGDANGDALSYAWEQVGGPPVAGSSTQGVLSAAFPVEGAYAFSVAATDPAGASDQAEAVVVALGNDGKLPAASVVSPVVGQVGQRVSLDASASFRPHNAAFAWRQVAGPQVSLQGATQPVASFLPTEAGRYAFEVTVSRKADSPPARVVVHVASAGRELPLASAAAPAVASVGNEVTLDGTGSVSRAGEPLAYAWRQVAGPATAVGSADRALARAYLFEPGSYEFELGVSDAAGQGLPARVRIEARADDAPIPVARISAPASAAVGDRVTLDGAASTGGTAYRWTQQGGPWVLLGAGPAVTFRPRAAGTYVFELEVDDGQVRSAPARVSVVVGGDGMGN